MKKTFILTAFAFLIASVTSVAQESSKLVSNSGHINFFSHTAIEDITADNYKVVSTLDLDKNIVVFSAPMQSFEFEKSMMQKHYNSPKFLDTKAFPKAKFKGSIANLDEMDLTTDGVYPAQVSGSLTMHGITKDINEEGSITIEGDKITINSTMKLTLSDYEIAFKKGKPSTNIAKTIDVTIVSEYMK